MDYNLSFEYHAALHCNINKFDWRAEEWTDDIYKQQATVASAHCAHMQADVICGVWIIKNKWSVLSVYQTSTLEWPIRPREITM